MPPTDQPRGFPATLRAWRAARGLSQFDLAERVGVSTRHLSFLETGRARPSRDMALALADGLMCPRAARNHLLLEAGFAPLYPATPLSADALAPFRTILDEMIARHAPFPAMVCDSHWTIQHANASAQALLGPLHGSAGEMNIIRMLTQSPHAPTLIMNFTEVLEDMVGRVRLEALEAGPDSELGALLGLLIDCLKGQAAQTAAPLRRPVAPVELATPHGPWRFLSTIAHFGTSEDVTVRDLRLELLFPADEPTRSAFLRVFDSP
jgi:transcriptional regulator with XRE-family HTH domain